MKRIVIILLALAVIIFLQCCKNSHRANRTIDSLVTAQLADTLPLDRIMFPNSSSIGFFKRVDSLLHKHTFHKKRKSRMIKGVYIDTPLHTYGKIIMGGLDSIILTKYDSVITIYDTVPGMFVGYDTTCDICPVIGVKGIAIYSELKDLNGVQTFRNLYPDLVKIVLYNNDSSFYITNPILSRQPFSNGQHD